MFFALFAFILLSHSSLIIDASQCSTNTYFNPATLSCITCPFKNNLIYNKLINNCECIDGYSPSISSPYSSTNPYLILSCDKCDATAYGKCFAFDSSQVEINSTSGKFQCVSSLKGYRLYFNPISEKVTCIQCPSGSYAPTGSYECISCPYPDQHYTLSTATNTYTCTCVVGKTLNGRYCVDSTQAITINGFGTTASSLSFNNLQTENNINYGSTSYNSQLMKDYYELSVAECIFGGNLTACNILANLCVLTQYN